MKMTPIDNGFFQVSTADARRLNNGTLPKTGYEALVVHEGKHYWLARTFVHDKQGRRKQVWSVRDAGNWRLINGVAVL